VVNKKSKNVSQSAVVSKRTSKNGNYLNNLFALVFYLLLKDTRKVFLCFAYGIFFFNSFNAKY